MAQLTYSFDFYGTDAEVAEKIRNGGENLMCTLLDTDWIVTAVGGIPLAPRDEYPDLRDDQVAVPWYWMLITFQWTFVFGDGFGVGIYSADSLMHAQSMAYAKDTAYAQGWHLDEKGQPISWPTPEAFADAIGAWARAQLRAGQDVAPCTIYTDDVVPIDNQNFPPKHDWLNESTVNEMQSNNSAVPWMRLQMLLHPFTPTLDLDDDTSPQSVVAALLASTAAEVFPALAAAAVRMAVSKLLAAQVPYHLLSTASWGVVPSLARRIEFVQALGDWSRPGRNEVQLVQNSFSHVLVHYDELRMWIGNLPDPYGTAKLIMSTGWSDTHVLDLSGVHFLNESLLHADFKIYDTNRSVQGNVEYLLSEFARRKNLSSLPASADADGNSANERANTHVGDSTQQLAKLDCKLTDFMSEKGDLYGGMTIVLHSEAVPAIRFILSQGVTVAQLPPCFMTWGRHMPGKMMEYFVDAIKHNDNGELDVDLEDLNPSDFFKPGVGVNKRQVVFNNIFSGKVGPGFLHWDTDFVHPIAKVLDPKAKPFDSMADVYADPVRRALHVTYVTRALHTLGKLQSDPFSFPAMVASWEPLLTRATQRGEGMKKDALREICTLMEGSWRNYMSTTTASLALGVPWTKAWVESDCAAIAHFESWKDEFGETQRLAKRLKHTFEVRI